MSEEEKKDSSRKLKQSIHDMNALRQSEPFFIKKAKNGPDAIEMKERNATVKVAEIGSNPGSKLIGEESKKSKGDVDSLA